MIKKMLRSNSQRIYILPIKGGLFFGCMLFLMLLISMTYQNNLSYFFTFLLFSIYFLSIIHTHNNLTGVQIKKISFGNLYHNSEGFIYLTIKNSHNSIKSLINIKIVDDKNGNFTGREITIGKIEPYSVVTVEVPVTPKRRGQMAISSIRLSTAFPLNLFSAWIHQKKDLAFVSYPQSLGRKALPENFLLGEKESRNSEKNRGQDFSGHRKYQWGESQKHLDWKAYARGKGELIKEFEDGGDDFSILFDFSKLAGSDLESKISQLALWLECASNENKKFGLKLKEKLYPPNRGRSHYFVLLRSLALFEETANG